MMRDKTTNHRDQLAEGDEDEAASMLMFYDAAEPVFGEEEHVMMNVEINGR